MCVGVTMARRHNELLLVAMVSVVVMLRASGSVAAVRAVVGGVMHR